MLENFCPIWGVKGISERFCEGCGFLNNEGLCTMDVIRGETYEVMERLEIGL